MYDCSLFNVSRSTGLFLHWLVSLAASQGKPAHSNPDEKCFYVLKTLCSCGQSIGGGGRVGEDPGGAFWKSWAGGEEGSGERAPEDPGEGRGVSIEGLLMGRSEGTSSCKFLRVP